MSWRDNLIDASFRGVPFKVSSSELGIGRRTNIHEFANNDKPYIQDLGAMPDEFTVDGYVLQTSDNDQDYFDERDKLIQALRKEGPGLLKHPFYGEQKVSLIERARISESFSEGGIARFTMSFQQFGASRLPDGTRDHLSLLDSLAAIARANGLDGFADALEGLDDALTTVGSVASDIAGVLTAIQGAINTIRGGISSAIAAATGLVSNLLLTIDSILDSPCDIARQLLNGVGAFKNVVGMAGDVVTGGVVGKCSEQLSSGIGDPIVLDGGSIPEGLGISVVQSIVSASQIDEQSLGQTTTVGEEIRKSILNISKLGLFTTASEIGIRIDFSNKDKLEEIVSLVSEAMDDFLLEMGSQTDINNATIYTQMEKMKSAFVSNMLDKGKDLTRIVDYSVPADGINSLVLSYNRYEDITRESQIFNINKPSIDNPAFIQGGSTIKVLDE